MSGEAPRRCGVGLCSLLAVLWVGGLFVLQRGMGFVIQDEGWLWYGVRAVLRGEVPLRDFNSYDPGIYGWGAAFAWLFGDSLDSLRLSTSAFSALGVFAGARVLSRVTHSRAALALGTLSVALWIVPHWKTFGPSFSLLAVWAGMRLIECDDRRRHVQAGVLVGVAACFGRNFGLYSGLGLSSVVLLMAWRCAPRELPARLGVLAAGVLLGYAPMLLALVLLPGFASSFVESVGYFAQQGHLGSKRPIPWPWSLESTGWDFAAVLHNQAVGWIYVALPLLILGGLLLLARTRRECLGERAAPLACVCVGLFWIHHGLVHAAYFHLAQAVHPLLLWTATAGLAVRPAWRRGALGLGLGALVVSAAATVVPGMEVLHRARVADTPAAMVAFDVGGEHVWVRPEQAAYLTHITRTLESRVPANESLFLAPTFPGLYCLLDRPASTWDVYLAWLGTPTSQERLLRQLSSVDWAMITNAAPMGQDWLRLSNTNPLVWEMLQRDFERVDGPGDLPRGHRLLRRREP